MVEIQFIRINVQNEIYSLKYSLKYLVDIYRSWAQVEFKKYAFIIFNTDNSEDHCFYFYVNLLF